MLTLFMLPLAIAAAPAESPKVEWIAHRGESADAPENTLAAFRLAWERGVDAIELDVHQAADGTLVVIHDADTLRTTGKQLRVQDTLAHVLGKLDAGSWKDARFEGEPIPTLAEALATIPDGRRCYIEMKVGPQAVPALVETVKSSGKTADQLPIISFNADTLAEAKKRLPEHRAYLVVGFKADEAAGGYTPTIPQLIEKAKQIKADGLDLSFRGPLDNDSVALIRAAGLGLVVWTVDDEAVARKMVEIGVDGITTNRPAALRDALAR
jgi:glycerophosphoryl diester phosphodiesterase